MADKSGQNEPGGLLDEDEKQSIRDWFRRMARLRGPTNRRSDTVMSDLPLSGDVAADVKGGAQSTSEEPKQD